MNLPQLTVTRFVAALGIVVYHLGPQTWPFTQVPIWLNLLHLAVSYFFALSGFILVVAQVRGGELPAGVAAANFYRNRVARVYPLYLLALAAWVVFNFISNHPMDDVKTGEVAANALLVQSWLPGYAITCNYPGWSLSVEALFYAAFPLLYALLPRAGTGRAFAVAGSVLALCLAGTYGLTLAQGSHTYSSYLPVLHLGTFMLGMATGVAFVRHHRAWLAYRWPIRVVAVAGLAAGFAWMHAERNVSVLLAHNGLLAPLYLAGVVGLALTTQQRPWLGRGPLPWLGEISYGMYILHIPLAMYSFGLSARLGRLAGLDAFWFQVAILLVVSALSYRWIEVPARRLIRSKKLPAPVVERQAL